MRTQAIKTKEDLIELRHRLEFTQTELATEIGLGLRAFQLLEAGTSPIKLTHSLAIELISLRHAIAQQNPSLAMSAIRREAKVLAEMMERPTTPKA